MKIMYNGDNKGGDMDIKDLKVGDRVMLKDRKVCTVSSYFSNGGVTSNSGYRFHVSEISYKIHEADLPTDCAPNWYRGKPVYCEFSADEDFSNIVRKGFCIFYYTGPLSCSFGMLSGTESGNIKDWDGGIFWYRYARPATPPGKARYYILKTVDGKEEKHELTDEQIEVLGLEE